MFSGQDYFALNDVLKVASVHPFYSDAEYPPTREEIPAILKTSREGNEGPFELASFPITEKETLYAIFISISI